MRYLEGEEVREAEKFTRIAAKYAMESTCKKSQRGAVIVKDGEVLGVGHNKVTDKKYCNPCIRENIRDNSRVELCSALHAEQVAMLNALRRGKNLIGARMYHIKVKNGKMKRSDDVSCTVCSRLVLESGISEFVLWQSIGFVSYTSRELNEKSFQYFERE